MPAFTRPEPDITAMIISRSPTHVVIAAEVSRDFLIRHVALLRELARIAENAEPEED
jgi:hypothetical protein